MEIQKGEGDSSVYRKELQQGIKVFEESFKGMRETKNFPQKKQEYEKATEKSLQAIQDAASALMNQALIQMKDRLGNDYQTYMDSPTQENAEKIEKDLDSLRESTK